MFYTFEIYGLVTVVVFGLAGLLMLFIMAFSAAKDYIVALGTIRRIAAGTPRESITISRTPSRSHETDADRAA